jgi:hypothetical protein
VTATTNNNTATTTNTIATGTAWLQTHLHARDAVGQSPLHAAAVNGHRAVLQVLLRVPGATHPSVLDAVDDTTCTALHLAAVKGHAGCVELLASSGADTEVRTAPPGSRTALHCAAGWGKLGAAQALVRAGADLAAADGSGRTALEVARAGHAQGASAGQGGWTNAEASCLPAIVSLLEVAAAAQWPGPPPDENV